MIYKITYLVPTAMGDECPHGYITRNPREAADVVTKCHKFGYKVVSVEREEERP